MGVYDLILVIPPIGQIHYPYIAVPLLQSFAINNGYSVKVHDVNIAYLKYLISQESAFSNIQNVKILNETFINLNPYMINSDFTKIWTQIDKYDSPIIGFSLPFESSLPWTLEASEKIKQFREDILIIFGGRTCDSVLAKYVLLDYPAVDIIVIGEGENTLLEILKRFYDSGKDALAGIKGTATRKNRCEIIINDPRPKISNLDSLPFPQYSCVPVKDYLNFKVGNGTLPLLSSRGCTHKCSFCPERQTWGKYRIRSAENVVGEIKYQIYNHDIKFIRFNDCLVNGNLNRLERICDLIIEDSLDIMWFGNVRINPGMTKRLLEKMYRAGCRILWFGMESASSRMLKIMQKGYDIAKAPEVLKKVKEAKIMVLTYWIMDFPGEKIEDTKQTVEFFTTYGEYIDFAVFFNFHLRKRSDMFMRPHKYGITIKDIDILGNATWDYVEETFYNSSLLPDIANKFINQTQIPWDFIGTF